ncbi:MAG TPA: TadG family pilus assembly protein [Candidatus Binatia bacterium]|nr:TadG family pilus assembly protein [Candidatus Binatia bacterium]
MRRGRFTNQRGTVLLFTTALVLPLMIIFGGLGMDVAYYGTVDTELQRSMDAASLAGAGKLGFTTEQFPDARNFARQYGQLNAYRVGTVDLDLNVGNAPDGDIVLGIWDPDARTFTPSLNGVLVDAVRTTTSAPVPMSFLRLAGINTMTARASAIAWAPPPTIPPSCIFPVSLTDTPFEPGGASGCGRPARFISSSTSSEIGFNTAGWVNLQGCGTPNANMTRDAIDDAASGNCPTTDRRAGDYVGTNGGMIQSGFNRIVHHFPIKFNESGMIEIDETDPNTGQPLRSYEGPGWSTVVPVVAACTCSSGCPTASLPFGLSMLARLIRGDFSCGSLFVGTAFAQGEGGGGSGTGGDCGCPANVTQNRPIVGWTRLVITQVIDGGRCLVHNPHDTGNAQYWPPQGGNPNPCGTRPSEPGDSALREIYGYYLCELFDTPGEAAGPASARGKPKLVR